MSLLYTFIILFIVALALFLGQIAIQFIKLERRLETAVETLEEELVDVFGTQNLQVPEKAPAAAVPKPPRPAPPAPGKKG
jgi:hypothetical protein